MEYLSHMYQNLDNPRFVINEYMDKENVIYVKWDFLFAFKGKKDENSFEGVSRLVVNEQGKVISHIDYWDAAEHMYEKMPLVGCTASLYQEKDRCFLALSCKILKQLEYV